MWLGARLRRGRNGNTAKPTLKDNRLYVTQRLIKTLIGLSSSGARPMTVIDKFENETRENVLTDNNFTNVRVCFPPVKNNDYPSV